MKKIVVMISCMLLQNFSSYASQDRYPFALYSDYVRLDRQENLNFLIRIVDALERKQEAIAQSLETMVYVARYLPWIVAKAIDYTTSDYENSIYAKVAQLKEKEIVS